MAENILDDQTSDLQTSYPLRLIGIGVFFWLCSQSLSKIIKTVVVDVGLINELNVHLIYWLKFLLTALIIVSFVIIIIRRFKRAYRLDSKFVTRFFYQLMGLYAASILIEILYRYYFLFWLTDKYSEMQMLYMMTVYGTDVTYTFLDLGLEMGLILFCGIYLFKGDRTVHKNA